MKDANNSAGYKSRKKKDRPRKQDERMSCWDMTNARENKIRISVIKKKINGVFLFH